MNDDQTYPRDADYLVGVEHGEHNERERILERIKTWRLDLSKPGGLKKQLIDHITRDTE